VERRRRASESTENRRFWLPYCRLTTSSVTTGGNGCVMSRDSRRSEEFFFWGGGISERWSTGSATNMRIEKHLTAQLQTVCIYISHFWGVAPRLDPTGVPPLDPHGGLLSPPRLPVPTLTSEPGYATVEDPSPGNPANIRINLIPPETRVNGLHLRRR